MNWLWKQDRDLPSEIDRLLAVNRQLRTQLEVSKSELDRTIANKDAVALAQQKYIGAAEATNLELRLQLAQALHQAEEYKQTADGHLARLEKMMDYMAVTSTGKTIFAVEAPKPTEEPEVPEEQVKDKVNRLMNQPVEDDMILDAVKKVGRRPRAIQGYIQDEVEKRARDRVAQTFDDDRNEVEAEVTKALEQEKQEAAA